MTRHEMHKLKKFLKDNSKYVTFNSCFEELNSTPLFKIVTPFFDKLVPLINDINNLPTTDAKKYVLEVLSDTGAISKFIDRDSGKLTRYTEDLEKLFKGRIKVAQNSKIDKYPDIDQVYFYEDGVWLFENFIDEWKNTNGKSITKLQETQNRLYNFSENLLFLNLMKNISFNRDKINFSRFLKFDHPIYVILSDYLDVDNDEELSVRKETVNLLIMSLNDEQQINSTSNYLPELLDLLKYRNKWIIKDGLPIIVDKLIKQNQPERLLTNLGSLSDDFFNRLSLTDHFTTSEEVKEFEEQRDKLLDFLASRDNIIPSAESQSEKNIISKILFDPRFLELSDDKKAFLLNKNNDNYVETMEKITNLLLKKDESSDLNIMSLDNAIPNITVSYILAADNETRDEIIKAINRIRKQLINGEVSSSAYRIYLNLLEPTSINIDEQVRKIRAISKYFKNHSIEKLEGDSYEDVHTTSARRGVLDLIKKTDSKKLIKQNMKLLKTVDSYSPEVLAKIINNLEKSQSMQHSKQIVNYVQSPYFISLEEQQQLDFLQKVSVKTEELSNSEITVTLPDSDLLTEKLNRNNGELLFRNDDTDTKIMIKLKPKN